MSEAGWVIAALAIGFMLGVGMSVEAFGDIKEEYAERGWIEINDQLYELVPSSPTPRAEEGR